MATIRDYFETDFKRDLVASNTFDFAPGADARPIPVPVQLHFDFDSNAVFASFYVPRVPDPAPFVRGVCLHVDRVLAIGEGRDIRVGKHGELPARSGDLKFVGRVFVYAEDDLSEDQVAGIADALRERGLYLRFRGPAYARARSELEKPLAFISYDSGDRETVAAPLARALVAIRCWTWFDEYSMRAGDPLERTILKGLDECERCIVVLSPRYLGNQRWARREFDAIAEREARENRVLIIPVRCDVTEQQVAELSPTVAHRRSIDWDPDRIADIASEISVTLLAVGRETERRPESAP
jgi:hypothetical protein